LILNEFYYISRKELFSRIDQLNVWRQIVGQIDVEEWFLNPFRNDTRKGSCCLIWTGDTLRLKDFADPTTSGLDCIAGYMKYYPHLSWSQVCTNLLSLNVSLVPSSYKILPGLMKEETKFECFYRDWQERDLEYWFLRGVEQWQLERKETLVKPIEGFIKYSEPKLERYFGDLAFTYHFGSRVKIYFPNRDKPRFIGNAKQGDLWHLRKGSDTLVIQKSHKDLLVLDGLSDCDIAAVQSEQSVISPDVLFEWESFYSKILIWYDPDETGIQGANKIKEKFLYTETEIIKSEGGKDLDEMYLNHGEKFCLTFIKNNI
jgi:hypothetical protein